MNHYLDLGYSLLDIGYSNETTRKGPAKGSWVQGDGEGVYDSEEREYPISNKEYPRMKEKIFDLQDRLIDFAVRIIKLSEVIPESKAGKHIGAQLLRSGTSPAPNYGEAQSAESKADFIHKLKIALKELRETEIWLKIIIRAELVIPSEQLGPLLKETDELISILFKSVETAKKNKERRS